jgi:hypothetical protein
MKTLHLVSGKTKPDDHFVISWDIGKTFTFKTIFGDVARQNFRFVYTWESLLLVKFTFVDL